MQSPYFYEPDIQKSTLALSDETSRHCIHVLRMKEDEQLQLTDGKGNLFAATIINADKKHCEVKITNVINHDRPALQVSIAISLLKNPSRFEWFLEKATEIGVSAIIPLVCAHTEKANLRFERMNKILISAMLQSKQSWLPVLHRPKQFKAFINEAFDGLKLIAHCSDAQKQNISEITRHNKKIEILIGPEGDFSKAEIGEALEKNFIPVSLGNTRLRSETAGIVAAALLCNSSIM